MFSISKKNTNKTLAFRNFEINNRTRKKALQQKFHAPAAKHACHYKKARKMLFASKSLHIFSMKNAGVPCYVRNFLIWKLKRITWSLTCQYSLTSPRWIEYKRKTCAIKSLKNLLILLACLLCFGLFFSRCCLKNV